jgi:murein endopeptidase
MRRVAVLAAAMAAAALAAAPAQARPGQEEPVAGIAPAPLSLPTIAWRSSIPEGLWFNGRLRRGVQLPAEGPDWFTYDPVLKVSPDREWRRWGTDRLVRTLLEVVTAYRYAHPDAPRIGIGDLSRRHGGPFGRKYGGLGHASHQNGLDADVYYPRVDGAERRAYKPSLVDRERSQELLDDFLDAGALVIYVGPRVGLQGPRRRVVPLIHHDDHMHVRLPLVPGRHEAPAGGLERAVPAR